MSKRHEAQHRRRTTDGYGLRGPRYGIRESRRVEHYIRARRMEVSVWYVVMDRETDQPVSDEFSDGRHAQQLAERLNGGQRRAERTKQRERASLAPTRPLHRRVEIILDTAGLVTGGCPRHKTEPLLTVHRDSDGSVMVRRTRYATEMSQQYPAVRLRDDRSADSFWLSGCAATLTKAGLFATEEHDTRGPLVRVREL